MKVVKFGGSLIGRAREIMPVLRGYEVLIIPGGGVFANTVREAHERWKFSEGAAHSMAVLAMHQQGLLLSDISGFQAITSLLDFDGNGILLPGDMVTESNLEASWDVTSDSIACYVTWRAGLKEFIKLTDVDGILLNGGVIKSIRAGKLLNTTTCLDKSLPSYLLRWGINCRVVNGMRESNIRDALEGRAIGTLVIGG